MAYNCPSWLTHAVFYEIYPQSFSDSNGDGIGDIPGIIDRLDYLQWLGVNALWLNPCFESPFRDAGYDVSDYYKVAPRYGTNADLKRLFHQAAKRNMKVILDFVPGHTSIDHPWFKASCSAQKNKYSNWFIWTDSSLQPIEPEFRLVNGYSEREGSYITNFFWSQPALNYGFGQPDPKKPWQLPVNHPDVKALRRELVSILRFWLDMGAAGFRVDMAAFMVKRDPGWKHTIRLWQDVRAILNRHYPDAAMISEWGSPQAAIKAGFHCDFLLPWEHNGYRHLFGPHRTPQHHPKPFDGGFFSKNGGNICDFLDEYMPHYEATCRKGFLSLISGNHDIIRLSQGRTRQELEVAFAFLLTMPGVPFIYYGDEIGMKYVDGLTSHEGGYLRTGARTPMQWGPGRNANFSTAPANKLYLPLDQDKNRPTVADQQDDPRSLLSHVRNLITLRHQHPALKADGHFEVLYAKPRRCPFVYQRTQGRHRLLVAVNPSGQPVNVRIPTGKTWQLAMQKACQFRPVGKGIELTMGPVSFCLLTATT